MPIPSINYLDSCFNSQILEKPVGISNKYFIDIPNSASLNYLFFTHSLRAWEEGKINQSQCFLVFANSSEQ